MVTVRKDPTCSCCTGWADHLRAEGFPVTEVATSDLKAVKTRLGVPTDLSGCHTAEVGGYAIEGHVPAVAIKRLLAERPVATGLAVPGMPAGSPGMGGEPEVYDPPPPGIVVERSHCPHCKRVLSWYENIPVVSYLIQRGRCRGCGTHISLQYPLVEQLTMLQFLACVWRFGFGWQGFGAILLSCFLVALTGIDLRT